MGLLELVLSDCAHHDQGEVDVRTIPPPRFLVPRKGSSGHFSVVNLLPGSNTYNVAKISTDTKQLSAGATLEAVSLGVPAGKQKSALYLQKDMDTVSMQFENPSTQRDRDLSRSFGMRFRNLLPTGECDLTGGGWTALATTEPA